ncbi:MAG: GH92 family glycosyl hydrolase [Chloroherpetonaceae bacterium]|nr:GH92 family glycosyl hydrolase [Chloroherpetonaceae bacterium]
MMRRFLSFASFLILCFVFQFHLRAQDKGNAEFVNPRVGNSGHGHTFPGATTPFGMVQLSPDQFIEGWDWCSGYHYSDSIIIGFSHTHFSGTGIGEMGDISLMPFTDSLKLSYAKRANWHDGYGSRFTHEDEIVEAGYYKVFLKDHQVQVELTASPRSGFHRYTFPKNKKPFIALNLLHGIGWDFATNASIKKINDSTLIGFRYSSGWAKDQRVFFAATFSKKPITIVFTTDSLISPNLTQYENPKARAILSYPEGTGEILVKVGISAVSEEGALQNLKEEIPHWKFDKTKEEAVSLWRNALSNITIEANDQTKNVFYTALYHAMIAPSLYQDTDGRYRGSERNEKKIHLAKGFTNYTVFSLWDTYRAWHPLATLLFPQKVNDYLESFYAQYQEYGELPVWSLMSNESYVMIGYHAIPVVAEAYKKGFIQKKDALRFYKAMRHSATRDESGINAYRKWGFMPIGVQNETVSKTLEYAYDDWCIYDMAQSLGIKDDITEFRNRALSYTRLFDPATGFMRAKDSLGNWRTPFDPFNADHRAGDFTEGNAWQYSWSVQHDPAGLIRLMGGNEKFIAKLDSLFTLERKMGSEAPPDVSGLIGQYAHGNEPSHHVAYLYSYAGAPEKTAERVRQIMQELYHDGVDGLCGNDDVGQLSAWYIWSALGLYPVNPASGHYVFGSPVIKRATISLQNGKKLLIDVKNNSSENRFIQSITRDGKPLNRVWISHQELIATSTLTITMGEKPHPTWGRAKESAPPSMSFRPLK